MRRQSHKIGCLHHLLLRVKRMNGYPFDNAVDNTVRTWIIRSETKVERFFIANVWAKMISNKAKYKSLLSASFVDLTGISQSASAATSSSYVSVSAITFMPE